jgi:hypothetical protein
MEDRTILVYEFENLGREAAEAWANHVQSGRDNMPDTMRVLLDFRQCGPPSLYAIRAQQKIAAEVPLPQDTRVAYLIGDTSYKLWARMLKRNRAFGEETIAIFLNRDEAIDWLQDSQERPVSEPSSKKPNSLER